MAYMPLYPAGGKAAGNSRSSAGGAVSGSTGGTGRTDPCAAQTLPCPAADGGVQGTGGVPAAEHSRPAQAGLLQGQDIARHLAGCTGGVLLAVTLSPGADGAIRRAGIGDVAAGRGRMPWLLRWQSRPPMRRKGCWCSTIGAGAVSDRGRYSPGYGDWPLAVQPLLHQTAGYAPADRPLRAGKLPDDPRKASPPFGRGRISGAGAPCRMRPLWLCGGAVNIEEGKTL